MEVSEHLIEASSSGTKSRRQKLAHDKQSLQRHLHCRFQITVTIGSSTMTERKVTQANESSEELMLRMVQKNFKPARCEVTAA